MANKEEIEKCPKNYIRWAFVILGMVFAFFSYLIYLNIAGRYNPTASTNEALILTEHINEEDDYEKPVCKRLEESGERYNQREIVIDGEI